MRVSAFKKAAAFFAVTVCVVFAGCTPARPYEPPADADVTRLRWNQSLQLVRIQESDMLAVHLPCLKSKGSDWRLSRAPQSNVLEFIAVRYTGDVKLPCAHRNEAIFYFAAVAPGLTTFAIDATAPVANAPKAFELAVEVYY